MCSQYAMVYQVSRVASIQNVADSNVKKVFEIPSIGKRLLPQPHETGCEIAEILSEMRIIFRCWYPLALDLLRSLAHSHCRIGGDVPE